MCPEIKAAEFFNITGLPAATDLLPLPPGEVRMLQQTDVLTCVRSLQQEHHVPWKAREKATAAPQNFQEAST